MSEGWVNHGHAIYKRETEKEGTGTFSIAANFTSDAIKRASLHWYKMKWQFTASANDLWGEEIQGFCTMVKNSPLSDHSMFAGGKVTPVRARFFNMTNGDDAANDIRGAFLKFADSEEEGPFDIGFTTGNVACFEDVSSQQQFLQALDGDVDTLRDWSLMKPENYHALVESVRKCPKCWSDLDYYSHVTYSMAQSGIDKIVRFRLKGNNDIQSRLNANEQEEAWILGRPDMELPSDTFLHRKLKDIANNHVTLKIQVQVRDGNGVTGDELSPRNCWDDAKFPWLDLADVIFTYSVPKLQGERARYDFTSTPDGIQMQSIEGSDNFGRLFHIQEKVLTSTARKKRPEHIIEYSGRKTTFLIHVETGSYLFSGTDASVYVSLYGTKGRTRRLLLDKLFHDDFERGSKEAYYVTVPVIGDLQFIKVFLMGGKYTLMRDWFLSNIVIFDLLTRKLFEFPCYRWISNSLVLPTGNATLPQNEIDVSRKFLRHLHIEDQLKLIPWGFEPGLPGKIGYDKYDDIPMDLKFPTERDWYKKFVIYDAMAKLKLHQYATAMHSFDSIDDFRSMSEVVPQSETLRLMLDDDTWQSDEEFGRHYLAGISPATIRRMDKLLKNFPVTEDMVSEFFDRDLTLDQEIEAGHIYYVEYPFLDGIQHGSDENTVCLDSPIAMFYVRSTKEFVPIAIQLKNTPGDKNPIFTPSDSDMDWLLAKIFLKNADVHRQTLYHHVTRAHLFMEALTIPLLRQLPLNHPVYKMLLPHTKNTVATALKARETLLDGSDSVLQKLLLLKGEEMPLYLRNTYKQFTYDELIVPRDMISRGVDDVDKLPIYPYRDDAMRHWNAISEFSKKVITSFYTSNRDVKTDFELQKFILDVHKHGLPSTGSSPNGVPDKLNTVNELIEFVTMFVFNSSVYHAAINYGQLDYFSFAPNYPGAIRLPPPTKKGDATLERCMDTLPNKSSQALAIAFAYFLSTELHDEIYLGDYPDAHFVEPKLREILLWFGDEQKRISVAIKDRNNDLKIPYTYLIPENVPNSAGQ